MKNLTRYLFVICLLFALVILASCAQAAAPSATEVPAATEAPASEVPGPSPEATRRPAITGIAPTPTQTVRMNYMAELEYPETMRMGDSDVIVVSLFNTATGYKIEAEFEDHTLNTQELTIEQLPDYRTFVSGELIGAGFDILPGNEQSIELTQGNSVTWRWSISPKSSGRQRLSLLITLIWKPVGSNIGPEKEQQLLSRGIEVQVTSFLGLERSNALAGGLIGLVFGSGLGLGAIFWRKKRSIHFQIEKPNPNLSVEVAPKMLVSANHMTLLKALFHQYSRLILTGDFLSGYSGARTYLALPIREDGQADAATIVKIGHRLAIEKEVGNYENYVKHRLPPITARIQQDPVSLPSGELAAVQYTFISKPGDLPVSLRLALLNDPNPDYLTRLYDTFGPGWWMQREPYAFRVAQEYDRLLPPHFELEPLESNSRPVTILSSQLAPGDLPVKAGDVVRVAKFQSYEPRSDGNSLTLTGQAAAGREALRLRWLSKRPPANTLARVTTNRKDLLYSYCRGLDRFGHPDPIEKLEALLAETIQGTRSIIHGDLNLENILAGPGELIWLIDFAETRQGHTLFDFAKLNAEVISHVYAGQTGDMRSFILRFSEGQLPLCSELDQIATRCLFNNNKPREYALACYFACLGAMKYQNLTGKAKHGLYLAAAALSQHL
jgi:hypothetical protein